MNEHQDNQKAGAQMSSSRNSAGTNSGPEEKSFKDARDFILNHRSFIMASHARTDGDDLGSMLAVHGLLQSLGKTSTPIAVGGVPHTLKFLAGQHDVVEDVPVGNFDAIILFGCCDPTRTGVSAIIDSKLAILNIDHHGDNSRFGNVNLVDEQKSSVAELVFCFFQYAEWPIGSEIAKCLLTGIFTDTGSFMHANTKAQTFSVAAELMKSGARVDTIFNNTYKNKNIQSLKAWAKALENVRIDEKNNFAISALTSEDLAELGAVDEDTFLGFSDLLNTIPGTKFSMFIRQEGEYIKGSVRSDEYKNTNVFKIAKLFGGGGHTLASGFKIKGKIVKTGEKKWRVIV